MKILYLAAHEELEWIEINLLRDLGHEVFTVGFYTYPTNNKTLRQSKPNNPELLNKFEFYGHSNFQPGGKLRLHPEFVKEFDHIIIVHWLENVQLNWESIQNKMIWRSIALTDYGHDRMFKPYFQNGMKIVRMSPMEKYDPNYIGETTCIRAPVDSDIYNGYTGENENILTVAKWLGKDHQRLEFYEEMTKGFESQRILCGKENDLISYAKSNLSPIELQEIRQQSRCYFSILSRKAANTFTLVEAAMTGMPVITTGSKIAGYEWYEPPTFIENGLNGFISDDIREIHDSMNILLNNTKLANEIGKRGREKMISIYNKQSAENGWRNLFKSDV